MGQANECTILFFTVYIFFSKWILTRWFTRDLLGLQKFGIGAPFTQSISLETFLQNYALLRAPTPSSQRPFWDFYSQKKTPTFLLLPFASLICEEPETAIDLAVYIPNKRNI